MALTYLFSNFDSLKFTRSDNSVEMSKYNLFFKLVFNFSIDSESIASSIAQCLKAKTPIISIIIGEGGSGGAIALATADRILMLKNSIFSVISPEGCASILWRNTEAVQKAAKSLKLTAEDCLGLNIIDGIVKEMPGGAHRYPKEQFVTVKKIIIENLEELVKLPVEKIVADRNEKFLNITLN